MNYHSSVELEIIFWFNFFFLTSLCFNDLRNGYAFKSENNSAIARKEKGGN